MADVKASTSQKKVTVTDNGITFTLSLNKPTELKLNSQTEGYANIRVSQAIANVILSFTQCKKSGNDRVNTIDTPSLFRQDEWAIVKWKPDCKVTVEAKTEVDRHGTAQVTVQRIADGPEKNLYQQIHDAGLAWNRYLNEPVSDPKSYLAIASANYASAATLAKSLGKQDIFYYSLYQQSVTEHYRGRYNQQAELLTQLEPLLEPENDLRLFVWFDLANHFLYETREFAKAETLLETLLAQANPDKTPLVFADAREALASIGVKQQRYDDAIKTYRETSDIFLAHGAYRNALNSTISLGYFYLRSGDFLNAQKEYKQSLTLAEQIGDEYSETNAHIKLTTVSRHLGDFDQADFHISRALLKSNNFRHAYLDAWAKLEKAQTLRLTGQYHYAIDYYEQSKIAFEAINEIQDANHIVHLLANVYRESGQLEKAEGVLEEYLKFAKENLDPVPLANARTTLASIKLGLHKLNEAAELQASSKAILSNTEDSIAIARWHINNAIVEAESNRVELAKAQFQIASQLFEGNQLNVDLLHGLKLFSLALHDSEPELSLHILKQATGKLFDLHNGIKRTDLRRGFLANFQPMISRLIALDTSASAESNLLLAESVRAEALKRSLLLQQVSSSSEDKYQRPIVALSLSISELFVKLQSMDNVADRGETLLEIRQLSERRYQLEKQRLESFEELYDSIDQDFDLVDLKSLQALLPTQTSVLFLDVDSHHSHAWLLDKLNVEYRALPAGENINALLAEITNRIKQKQAMHEFDTALDAVSDIVIGAKGLPEHIKELYVITDGALAGFPFALLKNPLTGNLYQDNVVIKQHHSLRLLMEQLKNPTSKSTIQNAFVVSNPQIKEYSNGGMIVSALPYSEWESQALAKYLPGAVSELKRADATKAAIQTRRLSSYSILHFATHAVANSELPELGGLVLSNIDSNDNFLLAPEIKRLNINANLVVLSGCETTQGQQITGEGLLGLSRAFFESGAHNVMGSLWKVQDDATATLVNRFYQYWFEENLSMAEALAKAQHYVRHYQRKNGQKPWESPFYWAGFTIHGVGT